MAPEFAILIVLQGASQTGGGFHQSITSLVRYLEAFPDNFKVSVMDVSGTFGPALTELMRKGLIRESQIVHLPPEPKSLRGKLVSSMKLPYRLIRKVLSLVKGDLGTTPFAYFVDNSKFDLVVFVSPSPRACELRVKPFVWTFWDLAHLEHPEFPEVRTWGKFERREETHALALRKASLLIVDSEDLVNLAVRSFGIPKEKFVVIPLEPAIYSSVRNSEMSELPKEIEGISGKYFFYPAQLWAHKNHLRLVEAISILNSKGYDFHAVFVGKDHGAGEAIRKGITRLGMTDRAHFLGWVPDSQLPALYRHSIALVMASYFGPTNIPPLEALFLETPVIASNLHKTQLNTAALYFDADNPQDLAEKMLEALSSEVRSRLVLEGLRRLEEISVLRRSGQAKLSARITSLSRRIIS